MSKYRGNLKEAGTVAGTADMLKGGDVATPDDAIRSKAESAGTPNKASSQLGKVPGKVFTGRPGRGKKKWTAAQAAAVLGRK